MNDTLLGFAGGIVLSASFFSLIIPGIEHGAAVYGNRMMAASLVVAGIAVGVGFVVFLKEVVPHQHFVLGRRGLRGPDIARIWLFVFAITIHNIPEGLAVGVGYRFIMNRMFLVTIVVLIAILAASAVVLHSYHAKMSRTRTAANKGANLATTTAGPIEYAEKGSGMPLLSIHGAGGGFDQGIANAAELLGDGYRIIAPSRFGYLGTPVPEDSSPAAQADAHAALLTDLKVDKVLVVGISAGTRSAIRLALRHPERVASLILIVPGTYAPASPVVIENSRASRFAFWLVNAGANFVWWATEKIVPSVLIRLIGVPPEIIAAAPKADQDRVMQIVR